MHLGALLKQPIRPERQKERKNFTAEKCKTMPLFSEMYCRLRKSLTKH